MQIKNKIFSIDHLIFVLLFGLLPVDMLNGYLLREVGLTPTVSIAQIYKIILIIILFIRVRVIHKMFFIFCFLILLLPTIYQLFSSLELVLIFKDLIKIIKYLASFIAFIYFREIYIKKPYLFSWVYKWLLCSFIILVINIFLKLIGIGFPMYYMQSIEIGSKGLFYAGNEVSAVLIILSSYLMYYFQLQRKNSMFFLVGIISIITGVYLSSKTAILGTVFILLYFFIFSPVKNRISIKRMFSYFLFLFFLLPTGIISLIKYLKESDMFTRISFFWDQLDIFTFIFSNRNKFLFDFIEIFKNKYDILEKLIGVGQTSFERLNNNHIIELDFFDIYFAYGFLGIILFIIYTSFIVIDSKIKSLNYRKYPFAIYTKFIAILLITLSFFSGHVFNSGMAAIFMGAVFSLMYYKPIKS